MRLSYFCKWQSQLPCSFSTEDTSVWNIHFSSSLDFIYGIVCSHNIILVIEYFVRTIILFLCPEIHFTHFFFSALGTWVFSVAGALIAIPVGIKRKSLAPLVFFGTTGTMLDIIMGVSACEREHAERQMQLLEAQNAALADVGDESWLF